MSTNKKVVFSVSILFLAFYSFYGLYQNNTVKAEYNPLLEGLPMRWNCTITPPVGAGYTIVKCQSTSFAITDSDDPTLMIGTFIGDSEYFGEMGVFGDITWIRVPEGYTISLFPGDCDNPFIPDWGWLEDIYVNHPDLDIVSHDQYVMRKLDDGQIIEAQLSPQGKKKFQYYPPPVSGCENNVQNPYVLEYRAEISGDTSFLFVEGEPIVFTENRPIYRVIMSAN